MRLTTRISLVLMLGFLFAACSPAFPTIQPETQAEQQEGADQESPTDTAAAEASTPTDTPVIEAPAPTEAEDSPPDPTATEETVAATDAPAAEECPYNPALHATNPQTVSLASGRLQLVEFFAFW